MLREQMRTRDVEARRRVIFDIHQYAAEQQYYVYLYSAGLTGSWHPSVKNYAPNPSFDYGNRAAARVERGAGRPGRARTERPSRHRETACHRASPWVSAAHPNGPHVRNDISRHG